MFSLLLRKALPFALTFAAGAALGGLFEPRRAEAPLWVLPENSMPLLGPKGPPGEMPGRWRSCRMRRHNLVAETKPLVILFKPDAVLPRGFGAWGENLGPARVLVTFGSDGRVQAVEPLDDRLVAEWRDWPATRKGPAETTMWGAVERAARQIRFEPETVNGMPVSVSKEVKIYFIDN